MTIGRPPGSKLFPWTRYADVVEQMILDKVPTQTAADKLSELAQQKCSKVAYQQYCWRAGYTRRDGPARGRMRERVAVRGMPSGLRPEPHVERHPIILPIQSFSPRNVTGPLMGDPPPGRTPWALP